MKLLLDRGGEKLITEEVLKAAAKNLDSGEGLVPLLLDRGGEKVITEEVLKAAADNDN
jgi:hypothetical protein